MIGLVYFFLMNLVNAVTSGSIGNISRIDVTFHKKAINGSVMEFFLLITLTVVHRRQPRLSWPSAPAKEGTRYSLNLVVSGHKQLWSPPAANRLSVWLRNNASTGHSGWSCCCCVSNAAPMPPPHPHASPVRGHSAAAVAVCSWSNADVRCSGFRGATAHCHLTPRYNYMLQSPNLIHIWS